MKQSPISKQVHEVVTAIEYLRQQRQNTHRKSGFSSSKTFSQDELCSVAYPSYKNLLKGRTRRIPARDALIAIADYLECTSSERNELLLVAGYAGVDEASDVSQHRLITILFISATVSGQNSRDDDTQVTSLFWKEASELVNKFGGIVEDCMANMLLAVWSAKESREDDPYRAAKAALALRNRAAKSNLTLKGGIHIGLVTINEQSGSAKLKTKGRNLDVAIKLERRANPEEIRISRSAYRHMRKLVVTHAVDDEYVLLEDKFQQSLDAHAREIFVGRILELQVLRNGLENVGPEIVAQSVTIIGESGIGKTKLLKEFTDSLPSTIHLFNASAERSNRTQPYYLIRKLFLNKYKVPEDEPFHLVEVKIRDELNTVFADLRLGTAYVDYMTYLIGLQETKEHRDVQPNAQNHAFAMRGLREYFLQLGKKAKIVVIVDDIQWADEESLKTLIFLSQSFLPILIICSSRPELLEEKPNWGQNQPKHYFIHLMPFNDTECRSIVTHYLQDLPIRPAFSVKIKDVVEDIVVKQSMGNPYFIEELLHFLTEEGLIYRSLNGSEFSEDVLSTIEIPTTLSLLIQTRFDRLSPAEQNVLQLAAIIGVVFWEHALISLWSKSSPIVGKSHFKFVLDMLSRKGFITRRSVSIFTNTTEYAFNHTIQQRAIYEKIPKSEKTHYHGLIAQWLCKIADNTMRHAENAAVISYHYEKSDQARQASTWLYIAAEDAISRHANQSALNYTNRALGFLSDDDIETHYNILLLREQIHKFLNLQQEQLKDLQLLNELVYLLNNQQKEIELYIRWAEYLLLTGDYSNGLTYSRKAVSNSKEIDLPSLEIRSVLVHSELELQLGNVQSGFQSYHYAIEAARKYRKPLLEIAGLFRLGVLFFNQGKFDDAFSYFKSALNLTISQKDLINQAKILNALGGVLFSLNRYEEAHHHYTQALELSTLTGDVNYQSSAQNNLGLLAKNLGDNINALKHFQKLLEEEQLGIHVYLLTNYNIAGVYHQMGEQTLALKYCTIALEKARSIQNKPFVGLFLVGYSMLFLEMDHIDEAIKIAQEAMRLQEELNHSAFVIEIKAVLAKALLLQGNVSIAEIYARDIIEAISSHQVDLSSLTLEPLFSSYQVLATIKDPMSHVILDDAYQLLNTRASYIKNEEWRNFYLQNIPLHKKLLEEYKKVRT